MITRIWQETKTGDLYAVALDSYGWIVGATGIIEPRDVEAVKAGDWMSSPAITTYVRNNYRNYRDVTDHE